MSRPWQEEELDGDLEDDIAEALRAAEPKLEIPKWTEHDIAPLYSIEGTEDLSEDMFAKRHAKLELDEKRRKKWDVQQIREQRRLEKLRKRHCKDELNQGHVIQSFFPLNEDLETICFVDTLPVQAFGEPIPMLPHNGEGFLLPWLLETDGRPLPPPKKATEFYRFGLKKMTRREEKLWEEYLDEVEDASQDIENNDVKHKDETSDIKEENVVEIDDSIKVKDEKEEEEAKEKNEKIEIDKSGTSEVKEEPNKSSTCDIENPTEERKLRIADCCYASPTVILAKNCRPCASRTQQRRRLRYSSYIYLTKRRRQLSMSASTVKTTIANNNSTNNITLTTTTTTTTTTAATGIKVTTNAINSTSTNLSSSSSSSSSIGTSVSTPATTTTTKTYCKNTIKKNSLPLTNKMTLVKTNNTSSIATIKNTASTRKSKGQQYIAATTTTTSNNNNTTTNNNTHINSSTTKTTTTIENNLDKTKENITSRSEKSDKIEQESQISTAVVAITTTAASTLNNSIKSKLRTLRSSSSPCSYRSSSNSNSSTNIIDTTTPPPPTTTATTTTTSLSITTTTSTQTLVTVTKTK